MHGGGGRGRPGAAGARRRGPDGGAATPGSLAGERAERKRGREGRTATFFLLYSKKVIFTTGGGRREEETSDGGLVTSLGLPQPPPRPAPQPPKLPTVAFPARRGEEMLAPCSSFYSAAERKWRSWSMTADSSQSADRTIVTHQVRSRRGAGKESRGRMRRQGGEGGADVIRL